MLLLYRRYVLKHPLLRLLARRTRKNAFLLRVFVGKCYRLLCRPSRIGPSLRDRAHAVRRWIRPRFSPKAMALAEARAVGGAIPLQELEQVWEAADRCRRAVCVATGLELRQLETVLGARRVAIVPPCASPQEPDNDLRIIPPVDLVIVVGADATSGPDDRQLRRYGANAKILLVGVAGGGQRASLGSAGPLEVQHSPDVNVRTLGGARLKVLLFNDSGFQYG